MKGNSLETRRSGLRFFAALGAAHILTVSFVVFLLSQIGLTIRPVLGGHFILFGVVLMSIVGIVVDSYAIMQHRLSISLPRQTPKYVQLLGEQSWVAPYVWGVDTGLIVTTYRVSFNSWLLLLLALSGLAPVWAGFVYGISFIGVLFLFVERFGTYFRNPSKPPRPWSPIGAQVSGVALMVLLIAVSLRTLTST